MTEQTTGALEPRSAYIGLKLRAEAAELNLAKQVRIHQDIFNEWNRQNEKLQTDLAAERAQNEGLRKALRGLGKVK